MEIATTYIAAFAAAFLAWRAFILLHVMGPRSPHAIRISALLMGASAFAILFGALGCDGELVEWGKTCALVSVALHIAFDRRTVALPIASPVKARQTAGVAR